MLSWICCWEVVVCFTCLVYTPNGFTVGYVTVVWKYYFSEQPFKRGCLGAHANMGRTHRTPARRPLAVKHSTSSQFQQFRHSFVKFKSVHLKLAIYRGAMGEYASSLLCFQTRTSIVLLFNNVNKGEELLREFIYTSQAFFFHRFKNIMLPFSNPENFLKSWK